ncbi:DUF2855 family protein [Alisedimentitalea sp. MJ-SS2]|uniref:DUF2855 family protein n=1 Tax=Aliisedimentitalea sp. MJ-SS2 TaxID=3049795 RepID=UPI00290C8AFD|nr:DUF2855 family protein [Alisedimentitalea sp. MJ-SS2]MDU8928944.1 DUF2855 family protein [Alisedimentitalea sp. MJ-SS2]
MAGQVWVDQANITQAALHEVVSAPLQAGQVRLALESFALTVNNVTYAATGFVIGYWKFFSTGADGQGIVPVWGVARVMESQNDAVAVGERYYGFYPMAEELVVLPEAAPGGFIDKAAHRDGLPLVYNMYAAVRDSTPQQDHLRALLQPLLATSYLLFDWLSDNGWFGAEQIIVGSASSKTGLGLAKFLAEPAGRPYRIVGLTSDGNRGFVEGLGACDQVLSYNEIGQLDRVPSVYVDMAGNAEVKRVLHTHLGDMLRHSAAVGTSHWDKFEQPNDLPGPKPQFFFAPSQVAKRREDWGPGVIEREITAAWKRIAADASAWLEVIPHQGLDKAPEVYARLAQGQAKPSEGHVVVI